MKPDRPNVVLVNVDQWRGDCLGCAGHPAVETPHLDRLAAEGVSFSRAYAAVPSCIAARAVAAYGGCGRPRTGGSGYQDRVPWRYQTTLAGLMAAAGYHTQAVGKMHVFPERSLLGFHNVVLHGRLPAQCPPAQRAHRYGRRLPSLSARQGMVRTPTTWTRGWAASGYVVRPWIYEDMDHPTAWITTQAVDFLRRRDPTRPFFLFLSYHRPPCPPWILPGTTCVFYDGKPLPPLARGRLERGPSRRGGAGWTARSRATSGRRTGRGARTTRS